MNKPIKEKFCLYDTKFVLNIFILNFYKDFYANIFFSYIVIVLLDLLDRT